MPKVLRTRDLELGQGMPAVVVPLSAPSLEQLIVDAREALSVGADALEWRADAFEGLDPDAVSNTLSALRAEVGQTSILFTVRSLGQGSDKDIPETVRLTCLDQAIASGEADLVDVELCLGAEAVGSLVERCHNAGVASVVSEHNFLHTPAFEQMRAVLDAGVQIGADIVKLAVMATAAGDELSLMAAVNQAAEDNSDTLFCGISMGSLGTVTRLAGEFFGSCMTFCHVGKPTAPGQVDAASAKLLIARLHESGSMQEGLISV